MRNREILDILFSQKKIDQKAYDLLMNMILDSNFNLVEHLVKNKIVSSKDVLTAVSLVYNIPCVDIDAIPIKFDYTQNFTLELMKEYQFVPVDVDNDDELIVAISNPNYAKLNTILSVLYPGKIKYVLAEKEKIGHHIFSSISNLTAQDALKGIINEKTETQAETQLIKEEEVQNAPAVKFVDSIITDAIPNNASDIHVEPQEDEVVVRYRIDGDLIEKARFPISSFNSIAARIKIMANIDIAERRIPQDGRISMVINGKEIDFRVSTLPTIYGEKFVIRILDNEIFSYSRKELNFSKEANEKIEVLLKNPHGIILLTGPTGCGKTTTLYAFLKELNLPTRNLVTVEDPVEYSMAGINQIQVNTKANLTFATALRSILRQDPDIIMVGEIRDEETAKMAIRAAITGHLVLSTLHTNDSVGAVARLVDMGSNAYLVADALVGVISQRLVKKLCPKCKKKHKTTTAETKMLKLDEPRYIYKACGCKYCNNTGYKGRMAIHEILTVNGKIRDCINKNATAEEIRELAQGQGLITLYDACVKSVLEGQTDMQQLLQIGVEQS